MVNFQTKNSIFKLVAFRTRSILAWNCHFYFLVHHFTICVSTYLTSYVNKLPQSHWPQKTILYSSFWPETLLLMQLNEQRLMGNCHWCWQMSDFQKKLLLLYSKNAIKARWHASGCRYAYYTHIYHIYIYAYTVYNCIG